MAHRFLVRFNGSDIIILAVGSEVHRLSSDGSVKFY